MVDKIANNIAQAFIELNVITKAAGLVETFHKPGPNKTSKRWPVAASIYRKLDHEDTCPSDQPYEYMLPDKVETGIMFCEDLGVHLRTKHSRLSKYSGRLKLVFWFNMKKIGLDVSRSTLQELIWSHMPLSYYQDSYLIACNISIDQVAPISFDPFKKYDLEEKQKQYLKRPYEKIVLNIKYSAVVNNKACPEVLTLNPETC